MSAGTPESARPTGGDAHSAPFVGLQLLDRSGASALYAAVEAGTGRRVALKVVDAAAPPFVHDGLRREAEYLAALGTHPHVITLYQRTVLPDGRDALVLQACAGSAGAVTRAHRMPVPEAVAMIIKIAGAAETVHYAGLIHCAIRPQNILLTEFGEPVLSDFAMARPPGETSVVDMDETTAHTAPELLLGEGPTPATDVYGLSSTLYELISGVPAYDGESPATVSLRILAGGAHPIVAPNVPLELSDLLLWGMSADPAERPPSAAWLAEELGRLEHANGWLRTKMVTGAMRVEPRDS